MILTELMPSCKRNILTLRCFHDFSGYFQDYGNYLTVFSAMSFNVRNIENIAEAWVSFWHNLPTKIAVQYRRIFQLLLNIRKTEIGCLGFCCRSVASWSLQILIYGYLVKTPTILSILCVSYLNDLSCSDRRWGE